MGQDTQNDEVVIIHTLPPFFTERREEFHYYIARLNQAAWGQDIEERNKSLAEYLERVDYISGRIFHRLNPEDQEKVREIKAFIRKFGIEYNEDIEAGLPQLNEYHSQLATILDKYDFDKIAPTILRV
jgi:hypothetical protein